MPAQLHHVGEIVDMVGMEMRQENRVDRADGNANLREALCRSSPGIELQPDVTAIIGLIAVLDERAGASLAFEDRRSSLDPSQRDFHAWLGEGGRARGKPSSGCRAADRDQ
jgi:anti-sigma factor ChrR (cupin superfamily)